MKKELKDYLHLYLGANYIIKYKYKTHYTRKALPRLTNGSYYNVVSLLRFPQYYDVKLVLRPLSDMKVEEASEVFKIRGKNSFKEFEGESTRYLLSKHFDLFDLIEAGLAIDSSKLTK